MKKLLALLLVMVMALSVVACTPSGSGTGDNSGSNETQQGGTNQTPETPDEPELKVPSGPNDDLVLDENGMGYCGVCGGDPVKWTPIYDGTIGTIKEAANLHYYFAADNITTGDGPFFWGAAKNVNLCLHLNNKTVDVRGCLRTGSSNDLNIMGKGTLNYLGNTSKYEAHNAALFIPETGNLTIYGGTYKSDAGKPVVATPQQGTPNIKLTGDAVFSKVSSTLGSLTIDGDVKIDELVVGQSTHANMQGKYGKIWVARTFTGEVKSFTFPGEMVDNKVPTNYAAAMGAFTGKITTADGVALTGTAGALVTAAQ